jgi:cyclopropane fatty-acyl-phospholipid synthase-like methyltransferase
MWNKRYDCKDFVYGTDPNHFLAENAHYLSGPVLSLAEGEGRNAVYLASLGLDVLGVDMSDVGLKKAITLAASKGLTIQTEIADLSTYTPPENYFGSAISIYAHLPKSIRERLYPLVEKSLKPGGIIMFEAFSKSQIERNTGGPKNIDMLVSIKELAKAFPNCEPILLKKTEREVHEGRFHNGLASVIQFIARKKG